MSFIYPLFLWAGAALAIPIIIHLFNLRRYKTVYFPHTRFLKDLKLHSQKQSKVQYKLLLTARLLFLAALILAFAQPFLNNNQTSNANALQIIYVDNSFSMSAPQGARSLLEMAKEAAIKQVQAAPPGSRFLLLTNDRPTSIRPEPADKVYNDLQHINLSTNHKTVQHIIGVAQSLLQNNDLPSADLYYYSDFQQNVLQNLPEPAELKNLHFYGMPLQSKQPQNVYIDTAYLASPMLQPGKNNVCIVHTKLIGTPPQDAPVLQLSINGQVKSATTLNFNDQQERIDTLNFQVLDGAWQQIQIQLNDLAINFDDTFRIAARSGNGLAVLSLNQGSANPYIQASFRSYDGFRLNQLETTTPPADVAKYNLLIVNNVTRFDAPLLQTINDRLQQGQSVFLIPGKTASYAMLNEGLRQIGDIAITGLDTAMQAATTLQEGSSLVKDLFEKIPENVQLPIANWHYNLQAGLSANQQSIISFRNGDPLIARYTVSKGQLYICTSGLDLLSGNFAISYFFAPFIYQMTLQSGSSHVYALSADSKQSIFVPLTGADNRATLHIYGPNIDVVPPQQPTGMGVEVFVDKVLQQAGFYSVAAPTADTTLIAMNQSIAESLIGIDHIDSLKGAWKANNIYWPTEQAALGNLKASNNHFPLWKVCVILAGIMLAFETWLLARNTQPLATSAT